MASAHRAKPRQVARLRDVARLASVHPSTASRVLRGDPAQGVTPDTRERVEAAARKLNYRPNALARSLRTRRTDTFGLIVPSLDNVGFVDVVHGIQAGAAEAGKLVMVTEARAVAQHGDGDLSSMEELYARLILDGRVDGLLVGFATADDPLVAALAGRNLPLVLVNRRTAGIHGSVVVDDRAASRMGAQHLIELGHERIGFIGFTPQTDTSRRRLQGFKDALRTAGLNPDPSLQAFGEPTEEGGTRALEELTVKAGQAPPTALFCASLQAALGILGALAQDAVAVPEQMSVIAFNDHSVAAHTAPPLTTIRMPNFEMGREAMRMLIRAAEGLPVGDLVIDEPPPQLVVRGSTARPPAAGRRGSR